MLVVHGIARRILLGEHLHSDLLQTLAAQPLIELLEAHLRIEPEDLRKPDQRLLVVISLRTSVIGQRLQSLGSLALLGNSRSQGPVLGSHRIVEPCRIVAKLGHFAADRRALPG